MTLLPYSKIKAQNLGIVLFAARFSVYFGYVVFGLGCFLVLINIVILFLPSRSAVVNGVEVAMSFSGFGMALIGLMAIGIAMLILLFSGLCAALVSWDYKNASSEQSVI